jgi:hypothetical protein
MPPLIQRPCTLIIPLSCCATLNRVLSFFWWLSENTVGVVVENADLLSDTIPYVLGICTDSCQVELWWMQEIHDLQRGLSLMRDHPLFERTVVALAPHLLDSLLVRSDVLPVLIWDSSN